MLPANIGTYNVSSEDPTTLCLEGIVPKQDERKRTIKSIATFLLISVMHSIYGPNYYDFWVWGKVYPPKIGSDHRIKDIIAMRTTKTR
jgi:hypothetical protein